MPPVCYALQSIADVRGRPVKIHKFVLNAVANAETEPVSAVQGNNTLLDGQPNGKLVVRRHLHIDVCHSCARDVNIFVLVDSKRTRWDNNLWLVIFSVYQDQELLSPLQQAKEKYVVDTFVSLGSWLAARRDRSLRKIYDSPRKDAT